MPRRVITQSDIDEDRTDEIGMFGQQQKDIPPELNVKIKEWKSQGKTRRQISWNKYYWKNREEVNEKKRIKRADEEVSSVDMLGML